MNNCGSSCNSNTLFITKPNSNQSCPSDGCGQGILNKYTPFNNPVAFCSPGELGPRKNREKVREQIKDYVLAKLGAPVVKVEMDEQQLDIAIDWALMILEDYLPRDYYKYWVFTTQPGKSVYALRPDIGLVRNVFYKEQPGLFFNANDLGGVLPLEYYYSSGSSNTISGSGLIDPNTPIYGNAGAWVLYKQYEQLYASLSSQLGGFEIIDQCYIKLYPKPCRCSSVIVHYLQKRPDFRELTQAMGEGALAHAKEMLGRVRGKYTNIPGPNGGVQLDGNTLLQEAKEEQKAWMENLLNRYSDVIMPITLY